MSFGVLRSTQPECIGKLLDDVRGPVIDGTHECDRLRVVHLGQLRNRVAERVVRLEAKLLAVARDESVALQLLEDLRGNGRSDHRLLGHGCRVSAAQCVHREQDRHMIDGRELIPDQLQNGGGQSVVQQASGSSGDERGCARGTAVRLERLRDKNTSQHGAAGRHAPRVAGTGEPDRTRGPITRHKPQDRNARVGMLA